MAVSLRKHLIIRIRKINLNHQWSFGADQHQPTGDQLFFIVILFFG